MYHSLSDDVYPDIIKTWRRYAPHQWWGDYVDVRFFLVHELRKLKRNLILDLGCNAGILSEQVARSGNIMAGLDIDEYSLRIYQRIFRDSGIVSLAVKGSWRRLMFKDETFDAAIFGWSLYHDQTDERKKAALREVRRILKPGGKIYFVEANRLCPIQGKGRSRYWSPEEACSFFEDNGFVVERFLGWNPLPSLVFWLPWKIKIRIPNRIYKFSYPPSQLVSRIPGWFAFFIWAGQVRFLHKYCRSYFLHARKN